MATRRRRSSTTGLDFPLLSVAEAAAQDGMKEAARTLLKASNKRAPRDDGDLIRSGRVNVEDLSIQVSYTAPHAHLQHERLDWRHEGKGGAKFLELAAAEIDFEQIVGSAVAEAFKDG